MSFCLKNIRLLCLTTDLPLLLIKILKAFLCHYFRLYYLCTYYSQRDDEKDQNMDLHGDDSMDTVSPTHPRRQQRQ